MIDQPHSSSHTLKLFKTSLPIEHFFTNFKVQTRGKGGMDHFKTPNPKVHKQFSLYHNSRRIIKILLSVSLFSVFFLSIPLLLQPLKPFLMQLFSFTIGKSYMFLLCNGLLAFIAKNSGLINGSSSSTHQSKELAIDNTESGRPEFKELEISAPISAENGVDTEYPQEEEKSLTIVGLKDGYTDTKKEDEVSDTPKEDEVSDKEKEDEEEGNALMIIDEDEYDSDDTEELNKKCEDFIRKMKAAFCSEPRAYHYYSHVDNQRALVVVM